MDGWSPLLPSLPSPPCLFPHIVFKHLIILWETALPFVSLSLPTVRARVRGLDPEMCRYLLQF